MPEGASQTTLVATAESASQERITERASSTALVGVVHIWSLRRNVFHGKVGNPRPRSSQLIAFAAITGREAQTHGGEVWRALACAS